MSYLLPWQKYWILQGKYKLIVSEPVVPAVVLVFAGSVTLLQAQ